MNLLNLFRSKEQKRIRKIKAELEIVLTLFNAIFKCLKRYKTPVSYNIIGHGINIRKVIIRFLRLLGEDYKLETDMEKRVETIDHNLSAFLLELSQRFEVTGGDSLLWFEYDFFRPIEKIKGEEKRKEELLKGLYAFYDQLLYFVQFLERHLEFLPATSIGLELGLAHSDVRSKLAHIHICLHRLFRSLSDEKEHQREIDEITQSIIKHSDLRSDIKYIRSVYYNARTGAPNRSFYRMIKQLKAEEEKLLRAIKK